MTTDATDDALAADDARSRSMRALRVRLTLAMIGESAGRVTLMTDGGGSWWNSGPCTDPDVPGTATVDGEPPGGG